VRLLLRIAPTGRRLLLTLAAAALTLIIAAPAAAEPSTGILLLAHGGKPEWNAHVEALARKVDAWQPTAVAFGMATRANIQAAVDALVARGVSRIVAVPLFVSSHSSVVTSTEYLLGLRAEAPKELAIFARMSHGPHGHGAPAGGQAGAHGAGSKHAATQSSDHAGHAAAQGPGHSGHHAAPSVDDLGTAPVESPVPISMTPALNAHPVVGEIAADRARSISRTPADEAVILVAHGPVSDEDNARWLADMAVTAGRVAASAPYAAVDYLTVRDDAPGPVRDAAAAELRGLVERHTARGRRVLIVPLLLSFGGIEQGIRARLDGLPYTMAPQGLMPDERIVAWVRTMAGEGAGVE
jgi:sirohydrochlorin cobaltochelatase